LLLFLARFSPVRETVGGSGFGMGFSTGFVRPSLISDTIKIKIKNNLTK
jgi:hypothetical protein